MPVSQNDLKLVFFILEERGVVGARRKEPVATGFFVELIEDANTSWYYAVTARHVIEDSHEDALFVRMNRKAEHGGFTEWRTGRDDWYTHDDADVAIIPFEPSREIIDSGFDIIAWPTNHFVDENYRCPVPPFDRAGGLPVGVGHEVYIVSLFVQHAGHERNLPIARFGHISRMPERLQLRRWRNTGSFETVAYLVECHSWGGYSGAPVVMLYPVTKMDKSGFTLGHERCFLGLISAHYPIAVEAKHEGDVLGKIETDVNSGIAVVTPAEAIRQLIMREDLVEDRKKRKKKIEGSEPMPTMDRA